MAQLQAHRRLRRSLSRNRGLSRSRSTLSGQRSFPRRLSSLRRPSLSYQTGAADVVRIPTSRRRSLLTTQEATSFTDGMQVIVHHDRRRSSTGTRRMSFVPEEPRKPTFGGGMWTSSGDFVRDEHYGWFKRMPATWFTQYPWFLTWYNARFPFPLVIVSSYEALPIPPLIVSSLTAFTLEAYIAQVQQQHIWQGTSPPNAYLVPNFGTDPPTLNWAVRVDA